LRSPLPVLAGGRSSTNRSPCSLDLELAKGFEPPTL
jgi:hypothetical protein